MVPGMRNRRITRHSASMGLLGLFFNRGLDMNKRPSTSTEHDCLFILLRVRMQSRASVPRPLYPVLAPARPWPSVVRSSEPAPRQDKSAFRGGLVIRAPADRELILVLVCPRAAAPAQLQSTPCCCVSACRQASFWGRSSGPLSSCRGPTGRSQVLLPQR